jgi:hypothetical protein
MSSSFKLLVSAVTLTAGLSVVAAEDYQANYQEGLTKYYTTQAPAYGYGYNNGYSNNYYDVSYEEFGPFAFGYADGYHGDQIYFDMGPMDFAFSW